MESIFRSLLVAFVVVHSASAITTDQLASFLNISSWQTVIDLPAESYAIEIREVTDGAVGDAILVSEPQWTRKPEKGIAIMAGTHDGKYKLGIVFSSGGSVRAQTKVPTLDHTLGPPLPEKIQQGDFMLFGKPYDASRNSHDPKTYSRGFVLRIKKV